MTRTPIRPTVLAAVAVTASAVLTVTAGGALPEGLFGSVVIFALLVVLDHGVRSWRSARRERARTRDLLGIAPATAARDAVVAERGRLADDIAAGLRTTLASVRDLARASRASADRAPGIAAIGREARQATGELRRQLGLLRAPPPGPARPASAPFPPAAGPNRADLLIAATVAGLAVVEAIAFPRMEGVDRAWLSVALTAAAAAAIIGRRSAPAAAALSVGLLYLAAAVFDAPIVGGFWCLATVGGLLWTIAARRTSSGRDWAAAGVLLVAAGGSARLLDPDNAALLLVIMVVALVGGVAARLARSRAAAARDRADDHERKITLATAAALLADRAAFAREVHDSVSHAVGLIAVQAAAAEVSWPADLAAVDRALQVVEDTAASTLQDLERLPPLGPARPRTGADIEQLIDRIRAAGTPVRAAGLGRIPVGSLDIAYRVIQESLTNVLRHSAGAAATVTVGAGPGLQITVADNGAGPDPTAGRGYGLVGLAERVGFAGGRLALDIGADGGFQVRAVLPPDADRVVS